LPTMAAPMVRRRLLELMVHASSQCRVEAMVMHYAEEFGGVAGELNHCEGFDVG
jgi:hypothetical protein